MLPIMNFYTEKEYWDILNTFVRNITDTVTSDITFDVVLPDDTNPDEYTLGNILISLPDIDGGIPIKISLSDAVLWINGITLGYVLNLPVLIHQALFKPPYVVTAGIWYTVLSASGDALIDCLRTSQHEINYEY